MMKTVGDLHKLRLINFDIGDTKESKVFEGDISKPGPCTQDIKKKLKCSTNGFVGKCSKWVKTTSSFETCLKEEPSKKIKTRISSIFKRQSNKSKTPTKRSISLYNLKQNFSSTSFLVSNPIKKTLKTITAKSLKRKQDKHDHYNKTDVRVLFMSETRKADRRFIKPNITEDIRKLNWINNSKSSNILSFKPNQPYSNKNYQSRKNNNKVFRNLHQNNYNACKFKQYKEHSTDPVRINDLTNNLKSKPFSNTMPTHYNVLDFSCGPCKIETPCKDCIHDISTIDTCPCVNKQVWVTTSCLDTSRTGSGDSENVSVKTSTPNCIRKKIQEKEFCKSCLSKQQIRLPLFSPILTNNHKTTAKLTLKYGLFAIAILVWTPCILMVCIYWLITYPLRILDILPKTYLCMGKKCGVNSDCGLNCSKPTFDLFDRISEKVNCIYNTLYTLMKKQNGKDSQRFKQRLCRSSSNKKSFAKKDHKLCPDPKNEYELYYTRHRGWMMKPIKRRQRLLNKRCECNTNEFPNSTENNQKKETHHHDCKCLPENLKDKVESKTIRSHSGISSKKQSIITETDGHKVSKVVSQKTLPVSNICDSRCPKTCCTGARTIPPPLCTDKQVSSDLITNKDSHREHSQNRSLERNLENSATNLRIKPRKNVSFEGRFPEPMDLSVPRNAQLMSPRLNQRSHFHQNTLDEDCFPLNSCNKVIKGKYPCTCRHVRIGARKHTKAIRIKLIKKGSRPSNVPKLLYQKYESKPKKTRSQKVTCWCKSARKNVRRVINDAESLVWKSNYCKNMYIQTLRRRPCFWIHQRCPSFYPYFLIFYRFYENVVIGLMFVITSCFWVPILCWCYICFSLFCRLCR